MEGNDLAMPNDDSCVIGRNKIPLRLTGTLCVILAAAILIMCFQFLTCMKISDFAYSMDTAGNVNARIRSVVVGRATLIQMAFGKVTPTSREEFESLFPRNSPVYIEPVPVGANQC